MSVSSSYCTRTGVQYYVVGKHGFPVAGPGQKQGQRERPVCDEDDSLKHMAEGLGSQGPHKDPSDCGVEERRCLQLMEEIIEAHKDFKDAWCKAALDAKVYER